MTPRLVLALLSTGAVLGAFELVGCALTPAQDAEVTKVVTQTTAQAKAGAQLFCAVHTVTGDIVVGLIDAGATAAAGTAAPAIIAATGASKAFVNAACGAINGIPVSPPAVLPAPQVAVDPPVTETNP